MGIGLESMCAVSNAGKVSDFPFCMGTEINLLFSKLMGVLMAQLSNLCFHA